MRTKYKILVAININANGKYIGIATFWKFPHYFEALEKQNNRNHTNIQRVVSSKNISKQFNINCVKKLNLKQTKWQQEKEKIYKKESEKRMWYKKKVHMKGKLTFNATFIDCRNEQ